VILGRSTSKKNRVGYTDKRPRVDQSTERIFYSNKKSNKKNRKDSYFGIQQWMPKKRRRGFLLESKNLRQALNDSPEAASL
jgi:hypothetical protein